jgi:hypothetical protein
MVAGHSGLPPGPGARLESCHSLLSTLGQYAVSAGCDCTLGKDIVLCEQGAAAVFTVYGSPANIGNVVRRSSAA